MDYGNVGSGKIYLCEHGNELRGVFPQMTASRGTECSWRDIWPTQSFCLAWVTVLSEVYCNEMHRSCHVGFRPHLLLDYMRQHNNCPAIASSELVGFSLYSYLSLSMSVWLLLSHYINSVEFYRAWDAICRYYEVFCLNKYLRMWN
jgi:hypothetical protein